MKYECTTTTVHKVHSGYKDTPLIGTVFAGTKSVLISGVHCIMFLHILLYKLLFYRQFDLRSDNRVPHVLINLNGAAGDQAEAKCVSINQVKFTFLNSHFPLFKF